MKKLFIISNESILSHQGNFFCDNIDTKSITEGLSNQFEINLIARKSNKSRFHKINLNNIKTYSFILTFLFEIIKTLNERNCKYLVISISPYTFFASVLIKLFNKKSIVYLRSDGYGEYSSILRFIGPAIYHCMFSIVTRICSLISCRTYILRGKKGHILSPSQINNNWLIDRKKEEDIQSAKTKLLYVGRIRVEKGIFSFLKIFKQKKNNHIFTIVGAEKANTSKIYQEDVKVCEIETNEEKLIKIYDENHIFVLPSFTEGHPMVLLESLSRLRPVIIFPEIKHVIGNKKGIFVANRNLKSFFETVNYIKQNYKNIQKDMEKNQLPTKSKFIKEFGNLILNSEHTTK